MQNPHPNSDGRTDKAQWKGLVVFTSDVLTAKQVLETLAEATVRTFTAGGGIRTAKLSRAANADSIFDRRTKGGSNSSATSRTKNGVLGNVKEVQ